MSIDDTDWADGPPHTAAELRAMLAAFDEAVSRRANADGGVALTSDEAVLIRAFHVIEALRFASKGVAALESIAASLESIDGSLGDLAEGLAAVPRFQRFMSETGGDTGRGK